METQKALFAAGCFWGVQYYFDQVPGVVKTTAGYTGGHTKNPTYDEVCTHTTGHAEAVLIEFDPTKTSYKILLMQFFRMHDPTQLNRQGPDVGDNYRSAIFYFDQEQHKEAITMRNKRQALIGRPLVTAIEPAGPFYEAEAYHQKFTERTGIGICSVPYAPIGGSRKKPKVV
ncbi:MAG TPA: peptide-methionine (S)-S-oxide reductase MsrA [Patescibacteria group bacterium]|nr:peptide-methionine (S)-S-oxide reductase MsrA [Patescibacteria group bacterium]